MHDNSPTPTSVFGYSGVDHDGIREHYLAYVEQCRRRADGASRQAGSQALPFVEWLVSQPTGWLTAFGVESVEDVKGAIIGWRAWCMKVRRR